MVQGTLLFFVFFVLSHAKKKFVTFRAIFFRFQYCTIDLSQLLEESQLRIF